VYEQAVPSEIWAARQGMMGTTPRKSLWNCSRNLVAEGCSIFSHPNPAQLLEGKMQFRTPLSPAARMPSASASPRAQVPNTNHSRAPQAQRSGPQMPKGTDRATAPKRDTDTPSSTPPTPKPSSSIQPVTVRKPIIDASTTATSTSKVASKDSTAGVGNSFGKSSPVAFLGGPKPQSIFGAAKLSRPFAKLEPSTSGSGAAGGHIFGRPNPAQLLAGER